MKRKYQLLVLSIFCCIGIKATEKNILLYSYTEKEQEWNKNKRSITLTPTATIDGSTIRIYSVIIIDNMQITVKDQSGNTVYSATTTLFQDTPYSFVIPNSEDETYQLQLSSSSTLFNGTFQVE